MSTALAPLPAAAAAFDAIAEAFDERFGGWRSVAAQRAAVRRELLDAFPAGATVLELGGGTGLDASWLAWHGRAVHLTDASPAMVRIATRRLEGFPGCRATLCPAETIGRLQGTYDGAFSNFAALNCITELGDVARGLATRLRPGAPALLVLFGTLSPGEVVVQLARRDVAAAFRRRSRGAVPARLGGRHFTVRYHRPGDVARALAPWFRLERMRGVGIFVPPSAAEPWISRRPGLLRLLQGLDRLAAAPLARLGDHVLYRFVRTDAPAPRAAEETP